jgi:hypothetical protein
MLLSRNGSVVTLTIDGHPYVVPPEFYRDWSTMLDEARRAWEASTRAAKIAADEAESLAKAQAIVAEVPGAWIAMRQSYDGKRHEAVALNRDGVIVSARQVWKRCPDLVGHCDALGSAPLDVWFRYGGARTLHRYRLSTWGSATSLCGATYCDVDSARGYRGPTKWKRCAKCEAAS